MAVDLLRYAQEAAYCERILAKSGLTVVTATLAQSATPTHWTHYPEGDVYDFESGAHWYYHSHAPAEAAQHQASDAAQSEGLESSEHGHFHCFVRPDGKSGPVHHLIAVSVDSMGRLTRLFTVARHVVDDADISAEGRVALLERFDVQLDYPNYLVNRWLTAVVGLYQDEIAALIREGAERAVRDPKLDVTAQLETTLAQKVSRAPRAEC